MVDCVSVNTHFTNGLINVTNMKASTCLEILGFIMVYFDLFHGIINK